MGPKTTRQTTAGSPHLDLANAPTLTATPSGPRQSPSLHPLSTSNVGGSAEPPSPSPGNVSPGMSSPGSMSPINATDTFFTGKVADDPDWLNADPRMLSLGEKAIIGRQEIFAKRMDGLVAVVTKIAGHLVRAPHVPKAGAVSDNEKQLVETALKDHSDLIKRVVLTLADNFKAEGNAATSRAGERMYAQSEVFNKSLVAAAEEEGEPIAADVKRLVDGMGIAAVRSLYQSAVKTFLDATNKGKGKSKAVASKKAGGKRGRDDNEEEGSDNSEGADDHNDHDDVEMDEVVERPATRLRGSRKKQRN